MHLITSHLMYTGISESSINSFGSLLTGISYIIWYLLTYHFSDLGVRLTVVGLQDTAMLLMDLCLMGQLLLSLKG